MFTKLSLVLVFLLLMSWCIVFTNGGFCISSQSGILEI